jgi:pilus assembly protein CpaB
MRVRGMAVLLAMLLAVAATMAVFLYVRGVRRDARTTVQTVTVIVSKADIPVGTQLDSLASQGAFTTRNFPNDTLVQGVVTNLSQMQGKVAAFPILAGEQISQLRFEGTTGVTGGRLGIPDGFVAITVPLDAAKEVGGAVTRGDHVTIYVTYQTSTSTLVPDALVLNSGTGLIPAQNGQAATPTYQLTLALKPGDAQRLVLAQEKGTLWSALLPPNQQGTSVPRVTVPAGV